MDSQQQHMDRLLDSIQQEFKRLNTIQDEIGLQTEDKDASNANFFGAVIKFANEKVNQVEQQKQHIIDQAEAAQTSILSYKKLMGEFASDRAVLDPSKSLQANLDDLQKELAVVKERYQERLVVVEEQYLQLKEFKQAMGDFVDTSMLKDTKIDVSSSAVEAIDKEITRCEVEYMQRKEIVDNGVERICSMLAQLGLPAERDRDRIIELFQIENDPNEKMHLCNMLVSDDFMKYIAKRIRELEEQKQQVESRKEEMIVSLKHLWNRLHIDQQECEVFLMANRGLTTKDLDKFEAELTKLNALKQERIGDFLQTAKEELASLWDKLYYTDKQRAQFQPDQHQDHVTDVVLEAYENEISRLQLELEDSRYILELIEKHMKLKKEVEEFEATTSDPNRLFGKGNRDPGRLLREERFRKRISRELPKVVKELEGALLEYEALKSRPFLVYGRPYFDVIYNDADQVSESTLVEKPKTPRRDQSQTSLFPRTPRRHEQTASMLRKPMTSPRPTKTKRLIFNTPQFQRAKSFSLTTTTADTKIDTSASILHKVRARNSRHREQKPIKRGHIFDDEDDDEDDEDQDNFYSGSSQNENKAPHHIKPHALKRRKQHNQMAIGSQPESDLALDLGIFDDGPDLSDMSEIDAD
ncbi:microtubule associated protein-domain-containing protein [Mucor lusitanicus]|uniref:Microtubule associated protein-domain-containing protein n=3 Tax=Mucor circinelloides f. lusitanicus TaxID=29924 RepID=A0A8H4BP79_MUCCL|nr:microtubule associated protein-domain-containing protein [Mucor lusitanicus]